MTDAEKGDLALKVSGYATYATTIFMIGWALGGLFFGILGDKIGRAKTMLLTILFYSTCGEQGIAAADITIP